MLFKWTQKKTSGINKATRAAFPANRLSTTFLQLSLQATTISIGIFASPTG
jgi:hypothetical protein